jgi:hypothetical protein
VIINLNVKCLLKYPCWLWLLVTAMQGSSLIYPPPAYPEVVKAMLGSVSAIVVPQRLAEGETSAEKRLLGDILQGKSTEFGMRDSKKAVAVNPYTWGDDRTIRAEFMVWLCTAPELRGVVTEKGIRISQARIRGVLDLSYSDVPYPLILMYCLFDGGVDIRFATTKQIAFLGSISSTVIGDGATIHGGLFLNEGFQNTGGVSLNSATIDGILCCEGGSFSNEKGYALTAEGALIRGSVQLSHGFRAYGEVRLSNAHIGGSLDCTGGEFTNKGHWALILHQVNVEGSIFMGTGFHAWGEVRIIEAVVGASLQCIGGSFENPGGWAIIADGISTNGSVMLSRGFRALGMVQFVGAHIGRDFECTEAIFENPGDALMAQGSENGTKGNALCVVQSNIGGTVILERGFRALGAVSFEASNVKGSVACNGGTFDNGDGAALLLSYAQVGETISVDNAVFKGTLDLRCARADKYRDSFLSWPSSGHLVLTDFKYRALIEPMGMRPASDRIGWLELQPKESFSVQPYEQLASVYRQMGYETYSKEILIAMNRAAERSGRLNLLDRVTSKILRYTTNYGYEPLQVIYYLSFLFALGWIVFYRGSVAGHIIPKGSGPGTPIAVLPVSHPGFSAWRFSLDKLIPVLNFGQKDAWVVSRNAPRFLRIYESIHYCLGWLFALLLVAGITGLVRRIQ